MRLRNIELLFLLLLGISPAQADLSICSINPSEAELKRRQIDNLDIRLTSAIKKSEELLKIGPRKRAVSCALVLTPDGSITDLEILKSAGSKKLDNQALSIMRGAKVRPYSLSSGNKSFIVEFLDRRTLDAISGTIDFTVRPR